MNNNPPQQWFEMQEIRRRRLAASVWIPLRRSETIERAGNQGDVGSREELDCVGSVAINRSHRDIGSQLGWMDIGLSHDARPFAFSDGRYKPADVYLHNDKVAIGAELVLVHSVNRQHEREWLVNQDLIMALGLIREGDVWRSANEGYEPVIRMRRDSAGRVIAVEIKSEYLRDYLCARDMALRVVQYRQRMAILNDPSYLEWSKAPKEIQSHQERFSARVFEVDTEGGLFGGRVSVMRVWRTDVDKGEDVPVFGQETDANTAFERHEHERSGSKAYRAEGELWREEWIDPAPISERVRGDRPAEIFQYFVDAAGKQLPGSDLNNEDVGRWLWFRPQVIEALLQFRGSGLAWYTRDTGSVWCSPDYHIHFGANQGGLVNVYAFDIAKLPRWQQRVWVGFNVVPDGPVSSELLDAQMRTAPARTRAPEDAFAESLASLDAAFVRVHGSRLFRVHENKAQILSRIHRFRAVDSAGLLTLAKDIARLTADSFDVALLKRILVLPPSTSMGSLKLTETLLAKTVGPDAARRTMGPLVGIYELRLGDAHLPSKDIEDAYKLVGIDTSVGTLEQAAKVIEQAASSLHAIALALGKP